jgi:hypothetical protein
LWQKKYFGNKSIIEQDSVSIADKIFTIDVLKNELTQVKDFLIENHPAPYTFTNKNDFNTLFNEQLIKINYPMGVREFYVIAAPLLEAISYGHTYLELPNSFWTEENKRSFPIELIFIDEKAYVQSFFKEDISIPIGSEIVSINNIKMNDIVHSAKQIISSDGVNETWKFHWISRDFAQYFTILYGASDLYDIEYIEPDTKNVKTKTLNCIQSYQIVTTSTGKSNLDFEVDKSRNLAVITIKDNNYYENVETFTSFIDSCFKRINNESIGSLILDIRDNTGGDPISSSYLLSYLEKEAVPYFKNNEGIKQYGQLVKPIPMAENNSFKGNLFILINGGCFSSTGHLCSILKYYNLWTFIGEETGGTYECNDAHYAYHTKETRLDVNVAQMTFATAVKGLPREHGILPDYSVKLKIDDIVEGKDAVKEFTYDLIDKK